MAHTSTRNHSQSRRWISTLPYKTRCGIRTQHVGFPELLG